MEIIDGLDQGTALALVQYLRAEHGSLFERGGRGTALQGQDKAGTYSVDGTTFNPHDTPIIRAIAMGYAAGYADGKAAR